MGAKPLGARASVEPRMTSRKNAVQDGLAMTKHATSAIAAGGGCAVAVGGEAAAERRSPALPPAMSVERRRHRAMAPTNLGALT